ncbi:hypothetical protein ACI6Q2_06105 [Chitinophagaceae bacterium LWZ2-11]
MSLGKKILSAFVDIDEDVEKKHTEPVHNTPVYSYTKQAGTINPDISSKFKEYFDHLMSEANIPGPDYYEFNKMTEAMSAIADERTRYNSAFAGLSVQGLDKKKLIDTAQQYLQILDNDAKNFNSTIDTALNEKVEQKKAEIVEKTKRIQELTQEITDCNNRILLLGNEIKENEEKLSNNSTGYASELENKKSVIEKDIERIKQYIQ